MAPREKKPKLKDQINSLLSGPVPAEQCDPDSLDTQHNAFVLGNFSDGDDSGPEGADIATVPSHAKVGEKMRMRADIELPSEYQGRVVSRSNALKRAGKLRKQQDSDEEVSEDKECDDDEDKEDDEEDHEMEEQESKTLLSGRKKAQARASSESEEEEDNQDDDAEHDPSMREIEELEEEQEANVMKLLQVENKDREKAQHARNQRTLTDTVLEARIRMQKPLALAARLPRGLAMAAFARDEALGPLVVECRVESRELVEEVLALRAALWEQNGTLPTPGEWKSRKDKGEAEVMLGSGAKAGNTFKALNQSVLSQISHVLQDTERLVRRTQVKRSAYTVLGQELQPSGTQPSLQANTKNKEAADEEGEEEGEAEAEAGGRRAVKEELDQEAFDDTDFYQLLLRDLIEASSASQATDLQQQLRSARRQSGKAGREVDTKASKGRKLRYDIQPKLVNFMFPLPHRQPAFAVSLFENLFKTQ